MDGNDCCSGYSGRHFISSDNQIREITFKQRKDFNKQSRNATLDKGFITVEEFKEGE